MSELPKMLKQGLKYQLGWKPPMIPTPQKRFLNFKALVEMIPIVASSNSLKIVKRLCSQAPLMPKKGRMLCNSCGGNRLRTLFVHREFTAPVRFVVRSTARACQNGHWAWPLVPGGEWSLIEAKRGCDSALRGISWFLDGRMECNAVGRRRFGCFG